MKRYIGIALLVTITGIWLYFTSINYKGLNSVQGLASYHDGLLSKQGVPHKARTTLNAPISGAQVEIDTLGIPHIFAKDANGAAYALGYMHARDRYFQMELTAYTVMGRLSEILGEPGIRSDRHWRRFEIEERAQAYLDKLSREMPDLYSYLKAYEAGINSYLSNEDISSRDPMYTIWNYDPRPWKAWYAFLVQWYMSGELTFYDDYFNKQELLDKLPDTIRQILYPSHSAGQPLIIPGNSAPAGTLKEQTVTKVFGTAQTNNYDPMPFNRSLGSNNWVVGASHTRSGQLFLCNDLHLQLTTPNVFYEVQLYCPSMHVYGYSIPGTPFVVTGHNEKIAWGITNGGWDVTEQYLLKLDPKDPNRYWLDGKWQTMETRTFNLEVKNSGQQKINIQYTVFGPLVKKDSMVYGLKWHPQQSCTAVTSFWKLMHAANWEDFRNALRNYDYPAQNFVYGDIMGNIGMVCAGKMPLKPAGYTGGILDGTHTPEGGYVPFDSLPQSYNPRQDYLFSANQEPEQGRNYYASRWFDDLYRPRRISEMLSGSGKMDKEDVSRMQSDVKDLSVNDLKILLQKYAAAGQLSADWELMRNWDGVLSPGNRQAIFYKYFRWAVNIVSKDLARNIGVRAAPGYDQFINFLLHYDTVAFAGKTFDTHNYFGNIIHITDSLYNTYGRSKNAVDPYAFNVPQMTLLPVLSIHVNGVGGSENTINVNYGAHPVIRTLIEIDHQAIRSWMVNAIGQTGRVNETGYLQQLSSWKQNSLHSTQFTTHPNELNFIEEHILFTDRK